MMQSLEARHHLHRFVGNLHRVGVELRFERQPPKLILHHLLGLELFEQVTTLQTILHRTVEFLALADDAFAVGVDLRFEGDALQLAIELLALTYLDVQVALLDEVVHLQEELVHTAGILTRHFGLVRVYIFWVGVAYTIP